MIDRDAFTQAVTASPLGLSAEQAAGCLPLLDAWDDRGHSDLRWLGYILATVLHGTGGAMVPLEEEGRGLHQPYGVRVDANGDKLVAPSATPGVCFYGRGYLPRDVVSRRVYRNLSEDIDIVTDPDVLLDPAVASRIVIDGMVKGLFSGKSIRRYFTADREDWERARMAVRQDEDDAVEIAEKAKAFHAALMASH